MTRMLKPIERATFLRCVLLREEKEETMKKVYFLSFAVLAALIFASCIKKDQGCMYNELNVKAPEAEIQRVEQYLADKGITSAVKDSSGVYYLVESVGSGPTPEPCSLISVHYTGKLTNDQVFDKSDGTPVTFRLGDLIAGWQKGLKHIKAGGKIKLYIPPSLGYGSTGAKDINGNVVVPPDAVTIFSLELTGVQ